MELSQVQHEAKHMRALCDSVREAYRGQITYGANHGSEQYVTWWDAVDVIGIDVTTTYSQTRTPCLLRCAVHYLARFLSTTRSVVSCLCSRPDFPLHAARFSLAGVLLSRHGCPGRPGTHCVTDRRELGADHQKPGEQTIPQFCLVNWGERPFPPYLHRIFCN
jgi:hypothetical protein